MNTTLIITEKAQKHHTLENIGKTKLIIIQLQLYKLLQSQSLQGVISAAHCLQTNSKFNEPKLR